MGTSGGLENLEDGGRVTGPARGGGTQLASPGGPDLVELCLPVVFRESPLRFDPAAGLHAVERRVERALLDLEIVVGRLADPPGDGVPVPRTPRQRLQDQQVQ